MPDEPERTHEPERNVAARLFAILAREAPKGVILRRGPSKWVELILWHTDTDTFERGQWFKGRIRERACDLSPDGSKFLYFGSKYHLQKWDQAGHIDLSCMYAWTAISKPPYYSALALWPYQDPYEAFGGVFLNNNTIALWGNSTQLAKGSLPDDFKVVSGSQNRNSVFRERLLSDGWSIEQERVWQFPPGKCVRPEVRRKGSMGSSYSILLDTDFYSYRYSLEDHVSKDRTRLHKSTWMDWDQQGRLVFTEEGKLYASSSARLNPQVIADFNADEFTGVIAPDWASQW